MRAMIMLVLLGGAAGAAEPMAWKFTDTPSRAVKQDWVFDDLPDVKPPDPPKPTPPRPKPRPRPQPRAVRYYVVPAQPAPVQYYRAPVPVAPRYAAPAYCAPGGR